MADPLVRLDEVGLTLPSQAGDVEILKNISLEIETGEQIAIVGPSGSGKSSLLMLLGGLEPATRGAISVLGQDLSDADEDTLARLRRGRMGVIFQSFQLIPTMTALENVMVPLEISGHRDAKAAATRALEEVELGHRTDHYPAQMSGGEQQRVALARALAPEPVLLLADEPTGNLDGKTGEHVSDLIFRLAEQRGTTLVLVTHSEGLAARCGRQIRLANGRIAA